MSQESAAGEGSVGQQTLTPVSMPTTAAELKAQRAEHDAGVWSNEVLAQKHESTFVALWDSLIHQTDKFAVLKQFRFNRLELASLGEPETLDWDIRRYRSTPPARSLSHAQWQQWLDEWSSDGYRIVETEFHHSSFEPSETGATSKVSFLVHAEQAAARQRFIVRGTLHVKWLPQVDGAENLFIPDVIDATDLYVLSRQGMPAFEVNHVDTFPVDNSGAKAPTTPHPIIVQDLDDDGLPEVIVGGFNLLFRNQGKFKVAATRLCDRPLPHTNAAAFADLDGDGVRDYLAARKNGLPVLYKGEVGGQFSQAGRELACIDEPLRVPINVVPGDIDGDGDLDLFIGQQKPGYFNGDIPTPYYNALDSFPGYLLLNDGHGNFTDVTAASGLGEKSRRRNFAATWIDFDADGDLDFVMSSDFSGTDVFLNDGTGKFTDISAKLEPQAYAFGMAHTFGDYNLDGAIDFFTVGMSSTTARRLEQMKLGREDFDDYNDARMKMGYGNRLYLWQADRFVQAPFNDDVARTGWSWGTSTFDFDNDGDPDIYVGNGQTSGETTKDYCTSFWCHDIYFKSDARPEAAIRELFQEMIPQFNGGAISWNGYEHNALLMNVAGTGFVNIGFLMGVAFEFDTRAVVSGDLDADGRVDLIVEQKDQRTNEYKLHWVRNMWNGGGHWIGVQLRQSAGEPSPLGARVTLTYDDGRQIVQHNLAGHSVWVQHDNTIHFGLGEVEAIKSIEIIWPNGKRTELHEPQVDRYHVCHATTARS
ncbi:MAG: CRTAC1 family protein [Planctomycetales bacterium]|nr:CRTAC1 family protein [Planctomycetales bacterium]